MLRGETNLKGKQNKCKTVNVFASDKRVKKKNADKLQLCVYHGFVHALSNLKRSYVIHIINRKLH